MFKYRNKIFLIVQGRKTNFLKFRVEQRTFGKVQGLKLFLPLNHLIKISTLSSHVGLKLYLNKWVPIHGIFNFLYGNYSRDMVRTNGPFGLRGNRVDLAQNYPIFSQLYSTLLHSSSFSFQSKRALRITCFYTIIDCYLW